MAVLGPRLCARAFSSCGKQGPLFIAVHGPLTIAASPVAEHRLQTRRPSNCGSRAQPLRSTRDPPRPGPEPASPALAGRLPTTAPPGKPRDGGFKHTHTHTHTHIHIGSPRWQSRKALSSLPLTGTPKLQLLTGQLSIKKTRIPQQRSTTTNDVKKEPQ